VRSTGAWDRYRDEIRAGRRQHCNPPDALCLAAHADSMGLDALDDGLLELARMHFEDSATILLNAAAKTQEAA
jgi:hypothetical protein